MQKLIVVVDCLTLRRPIETALGAVHCCGREHQPNFFETEAQRSELRGVYLDADRGLLLTDYKNLSDSGNLRNLLSEHGIGIVARLGDGVIFRIDRDDQNGEINGIDFAKGGRIGQVLR